MERQHIESLVADQVLGELSPPASWLLERYLAEHPEYGRDAEEVMRTIRLAQSALSSAEPAEAPLPSMPRLRPAGWPMWMQRVAWPAACAACLMLGLMLRPAAPVAKPDLGQGSTLVERGAPTGPGRSSVTLAAGATDGQFWSVRSWVERSSHSPKGSASASGIVWKAPFQIASN